MTTTHAEPTPGPPGDAWLYPRLPMAAADRIWEAMAEEPVATLEAQAASEHPEQVYAPTGGQRATPESITKLRAVIVECASKCGYPEGGSTATRATFDASSAGLLMQHLHIAPGEASRDDVWSFFGLVVLPDVVRWRFRTSGKERFVGGASQRNALQRLWWRAYVLHDPSQADEPYHLLRRLPEDAMVGLMERPGTSSNRKVALAVALEAAAIADKGLGTRGEKLCREAFKGVRQRKAVVTIEGMSEDTMREQIRSIFEVIAGHATSGP